MFRRTLPRCELVSTHHGQRRILKRPLPIVEFIRRAVESGVYRTNEEKLKLLRDRRLQEDPLAQVMKRFRQDIVRGASVQDYPFEYIVLRQNPPPPFGGYLPKKDQRRMEREAQEELAKYKRPIEELVDKYLRRQDRQNHQSFEKDGTPQTYKNGAPLTAEEYYRRLLGVPKPPDPITLTETPAVVQKAYASALEHYKLVRTKGLSEEDAMAQVDALLKQASEDELHKATQVLKESKRLRQKPNETALDLKKQHEEARPGESWRTVLDTESIKEKDKKQLQTGLHTNQEAEEKTGLETVFTNVLDSQPNLMEGMMRWSERLKAVPYEQWTVGASVALDHWIARQILKYSEETWLLLLEGAGTEDDPSLMERGHRLVQVREAMFPETILQESPFADDDAAGDQGDFALGDRIEDANAKQKDRMGMGSGSTDQSLEDLLQSLNSMTGPGGSDSSSSSSSFGSLGSVPDRNVDAKTVRVVEEMQEWRRLHQQMAFSSWSPDKKREMNDWVRNEFIPACTGSVDNNPTSEFLGGFSAVAHSRSGRDQDVDVEATRDAILSSLPLTQEESEVFWSSVSNEQDAAALLDQLRKDGAPEGISVLQASFWDLDYAAQLQQLLNLGAVRPLLDEYTKESDRRAFLVKYGDVLMTGVQLNCLVPDPDGPITVDDLPRGTMNVNPKLLSTLRPGRRYRLQTIPYRSAVPEDDMTSLSRDEMETSRYLFREWNKHKAARAKYEEHLFLTDRMGLTYDNPPKKEEDITYFDMVPEEREEEVGLSEEEERKHAKRMKRRENARIRRSESIQKWHGGRGGTPRY